jgi:CHAT domain-containing protein/Tfp pilus assembly protein PilF
MSASLETFCRRLVLIAILLFFESSVPSQSFFSLSHLHSETMQSLLVQERNSVLLPNQTLQQTITGADVHTYYVSLAKDQFARIVVDQQGVDLVLAISGDEQGNLEVDNPNGSFGPESVSILVAKKATFTITVKTTERTGNGSYELKVEGPREKIKGDLERVQAEHIFVNAQQARRAGANQEAIDRYKEAIGIWAQLDDRQHQSYALCNIGRIYRVMGQMKESLAFLDRALEFSRSAGDISGQAFVLNETGATIRDLGDPLQALNFYQQALELRKNLNDVVGEAQLFNNIGLIYANTGRQQHAIESYQRALDLWRGAQDLTNWARALNNIAESYSELGDLSFALDMLQEALALSRKSGNRRLEASVGNNIGRIYDTWADSKSALDTYLGALSIFNQLNDERGAALVSENIGMVYAGVNDTATALEYFQNAVKIRERLKEPRGTAIALDHLGYVQGLMGQNQEAIKNLKRSIMLSQETRNRAFEAYSLTNLGMSYFALGDATSALENYRQALGIQNDLGDRRGQAITLDRMGQLFASSSQTGNALANYDEALTRWASIGDKQGQALTLYGVAAVKRVQNDLGEARKRIEEAIDIVESVRTGMSSHQLRLTYFAAKQELYEFDIDVRMKLGLQHESNADIEAALDLSERARARNLLDLLNQARAKGKGASTLSDRDNAGRLSQEMSSLKQSLWHLRSMKRTEDVALVEERLRKLAAEYDEIQSSTNASNQTDNLQPLTAHQLQTLMDDDMLLLEYSLGEENSYLWTVTRTKIVGFVLPSRKLIESDVERFRTAITAYEPQKPGENNQEYIARLRSASASYREYGRALSREVLSPASAQLANRRLIIVADGALQYIPFAAMPFPSFAGTNVGQDKNAYSPLILNNQIIYEPSASTVSLLRARQRPTPTKVVAVFADPVFDTKDSRVRESLQVGVSAPKPEGPPSELKQTLRDIGEIGTSDEFRLERLPYSAIEANAIGAMVPNGSSMLAMNFDANRAAALSPGLKQFRIIHFATHGVLNGKHPELSGIVLSMVDKQGRPQDGFLMLSDIYSLDIPVELVVLSACQTGIGKQIRGEGLVGLTRGFIYAGAARVVASLWRVDDEATAELMKHFYHYLLLKGLPAPEALRKAQIDMIQTTDRWRAPYYWAGFTVQGEWK